MSNPHVESSDEDIFEKTRRDRNNSIKNREENRLKQIIPQTKENTKEIEEDNILKKIKELQEDQTPEYSIEDIKNEFKKKRDLRKVFRELIKEQPAMVSKVMEKLDWNQIKKQHAYDTIYLLKEMNLIQEKLVLEIWAKDYCDIKLSKEEKDILIRFNLWTKSMKQKTRNKFVGVSGYWVLTELGKKYIYLAQNNQEKTVN